jgi:hypothetical protein
MCGAVSPLPNMPSWRGVHLREVEGQLHLYLYAISFFRYSFLTMVHRSCSTDMKLITVNKHLRIAVSTVFRQATLFNYLHSRILKQFTGLRFIRKPRNCYYYIDAFLKVLLFAILLCVPCTQRMQWSVKWQVMSVCKFHLLKPLNWCSSNLVYVYTNSKGKKVKLPLCLTKYHPMKRYPVLNYAYEWSKTYLWNWD